MINKIKRSKDREYYTDRHDGHSQSVIPYGTQRVRHRMRQANTISPTMNVIKNWDFECSPCRMSFAILEHLSCCSCVDFLSLSLSPWSQFSFASLRRLSPTWNPRLCVYTQTVHALSAMWAIWSPASWLPINPVLSIAFNIIVNGSPKFVKYAIQYYACYVCFAHRCTDICI